MILLLLNYKPLFTELYKTWLFSYPRDLYATPINGCGVDFGWHCALVKRKWTYAKKGKVGRPPTKDKVKVIFTQFSGLREKNGILTVGLGVAIMLGRVP